MEAVRDTVEVMGVRVDRIDVAGLLNRVEELIAAPGCALVNNVNIRACNLAWEQPEFRRILNESAAVFCDGYGVKWGAWLTGKRLGQRMTPPDWIDELFALGAHKGWTFFFLGDEPEVVEAFEKAVAERHPGVRILGSHHGFLAPGSHEEQALIGRIKTLRPDVIITGMGMPRQEYWADRARQTLDHGVIIAAGALFRWYTGWEKRAPRWMAAHGLEWLHRLATRPRTHFRRYVIGIPLFLLRLWIVAPLQAWGARRAASAAAMAIICFVALFLALHLGGVLHETDQAALLAGALRLARGEAVSDWTAFYRYDNYYLTYHLTALALRALPRADPVAVGNALSFALFWIPFLALVAALGRVSGLAANGLMTVACAPAVLVHSSFLAPNFVSAGFLFTSLLAIRLWEQQRRRAALAASIVLFFAATAARSDALLLWPLLAWSVAPRARLSGIAGSGRTWTLAAAAAAAVGVGVGLRGGASGGQWAPLWRPAAAAAYTVFGLGASGLLLAVALWVLGTVARARQRRWFALSGLLALLLPFGFYATQLCSTRHWIAGLEALAVLLTLRRGRRWLWAGLKPSLRRWGSIGLTIAVVLPLFAGVRLPFRNAPRPCVTRPTYLPSADGLVPMGALLWNARERRAGGGAHDHNHRLWLASRAVSRWPEDETGRVPLLSTPMRDILALAVEMAGQKPRFVGQNEAVIATWCADLRTLLRVAPRSTSNDIEDWREVLAGRRLIPLAGEDAPYLVVYGEEGEPEIEQALWEALAMSFNWREFMKVPAHAPAAVRGPWEGHAAMWLAPAPFGVAVVGNKERWEVRSEPVGMTGLHAVLLKGHERRDRRVIGVPKNVFAVVSVWPDHFTSRP